MKLTIALDSGAYSLYNLKFSSGKRSQTAEAKSQTSYDFMHTHEFEEYMNRFICFIQDNQEVLDFYITLDILFNDEASWQNQIKLEMYGVDPIPVFHHGEDFKYFKRYADNYEHICLGGLGHSMSAASYIQFADKCFDYVTNKQGRPQIKVHGLAMTSMQLMKRYPWHSVDSSTWTALSRNGWVRLPRYTRTGERDWLGRPLGWRFTDRAATAKQYIDKQSDMVRGRIEDYLQEKFSMGIEDMRHDYTPRDIANAGHTFFCADALRHYYDTRFDYAEGANIYLAGKPGSGLLGVSDIRRTFTKASKTLGKDYSVHYLASYFYDRDASIMVNAVNPRPRRILKCF